MSDEPKVVPRVYILDTETTAHFEAQPKPEVIELAYAAIEGGALIDHFEQRYKPVSMPMTLGAMAVHHILPEELLDCPPSNEAKIPDDAAYIVGHNIDFDWKALGQPNVRRVCTLAMARMLWDDEDSHSLGACLYRVKPHDEARKMLQGSHSAAVDVENTFEILKALIKLAVSKNHVLANWGAIYAFSENARLPRRWTFGKYRGRPIGKEFGDKADFGYHSWCDRQVDMDPYLKKALYAFKNGKL